VRSITPRWPRGARRSDSEPNADVKPRRRLRVADLKWVAPALGAILLVQVLRTPDLRLHFVTGASLTQGALISAIALGVVLTYRGSGVVNFATGATAMYAAYVYTGLRTDGSLFLPPLPNPLALVEGAVHLFGGGSDFRLPRWPTEISFGAPLTFPAALALSLVFCVLMGYALHILVFRPLRTAPPLAKVVASVGVLLLLQAIIVRRFGTAARATLLGHGTPKQVKLPFSIRMNTEQLAVIAVVIAFTFALWALFRFTRFGIATRAAAENEKGAMLLGFSPDFLAGTNWVLSTVISGLLGILVAGNQKSVDPLTITLLIVPALSVALVGGLTSFGLTVAAAFGVAMTQALVPFLGATRSWYPKAGGQALPGVAALLPFLLIVGVMFFNGRALPTRGSASSGRLPTVGNPTLFSTRVLAPIAVAGCALTLMFFATPNGRLAIITSLIGVVISLSFVVITGYVGQISLAQMMLAGISGFTLSKLTTTGVHLYGHNVIPALAFPFSPIVGALGAMVVGVLVALPSLRVRGVSLAIVTFAFAVAMEQFLFQNPGINGGFAGAKIKTPGPIDPLKTATIGRGAGANVWFGMFCLGAVVVLCAMVVNLRRSATGRRFLATRSNERAAAAAGVDVRGTKLTAFALAAFIAGIAGALVGYRLGGVNQLYFGGTQSLTVFAFAYLGGIACISGAVSAGALVPGGVIFTILQTVFKVPPEFTLILGGVAVIATAILNPEGVAGGFATRLARGAARVRARRGTAPRVSVQPTGGNR
jgi:branched-chain amino acid transport system permease protein